MIGPLVAFALTAGTAPSPHAVAWGYEGHRLVCEIAWLEMTPKTRNAVRALLRDDPMSQRFSESCVWADEVRNDSAYARYRTAHYLNVPPGEAGVDPAVHCRDTYCVIEAIQDLIPVLRDTTLPRARRRDALKFLAHFVGDIHQPLHVGRPGDLGGNRTPLVFLGEPTNLHVVWDASLLQRYLLDPWDAARLDSTITPVDRAQWAAQLDPVTWANESYEIVERVAYRGVAGGVLGEEYAERARYIVEERILQAGYRLGYLLNQLLGG